MIKKVIDCGFEGNRFVPCDSMVAMIDSRSPFGIGADILHLMDMKTGEKWDGGVYFQFTKSAVPAITELKARKLIMNVCPFCKKDILHEKLKKKNDKPTDHPERGSVSHG